MFRTPFRLALPLMVGLFILANPAAQAVIIHDELFDGDLSNLGTAPTPFGVLAAGSNVFAGTKDFLDFSDFLTFSIAPGFQLSSVVVQTHDSPGFVSFYLYAGSTSAGALLENVNLPGFFGPLDLLQFDSAPGVQPAGDYTLGVFLAALDPDTSVSAWTATFAVTPIPVPAAAWLFAGALGALAWLRRRV